MFSINSRLTKRIFFVRVLNGSIKGSYQLKITLQRATIILNSSSFSRNKICAVRPIYESKFASSMLKLTSRRYKTLKGTLLRREFTIQMQPLPLCTSFAASLQIWILAESNGAYQSWQELTRIMCLNQLRPSHDDKRYRQQSSSLVASAIRNQLIDVDFFHLFISHMPVEKSLPVLYMQPK